MLYSYIELNFDVLQAASGDRYADGDNIGLVNLGPIDLFRNYKLATTSRKHLEDIDHAHIVSSMYKLITSSRGSDNLSNGFDRSRDRRERELTNYKKIKGKYRLRIYLKDVFGFAEHQETGTFGLGYELTLARNTDNAVLNKGNATNNAEIKINAIEWYVLHYSPSLEEYNKLLNQIMKETTTNLPKPEKSVFMKEVNTQKFRSFELGTQEGISVTVWIYVVFQQNDKQHDQNINNDTFVRLFVISAQCVIGTEKYPDNTTLLNYNDDKYSNVYGQINEAFKALTNDNILQPYISEDGFRSPIDGDSFGYNVHSFDISYQKFFESAQEIKVE